MSLMNRIVSLFHTILKRRKEVFSMKFNMLGDANHAGPVRLSDVYSSAVGSAKDGVAASQRALYDAYNSLNSRMSSCLKYLGT